MKHAERRAFAEEIAAKTSVLTAKAKGRYAFCIGDMERNKLTVLGIFGIDMLYNDIHISKAEEISELVCESATLIQKSEVTEMEFVCMIRRADRAGFLVDRRSIIDSFYLGGDVLDGGILDSSLFNGGVRRGYEFVGREMICEAGMTKDKANAAAKNFYCGDTLDSEIERIYNSPIEEKFKGHPVHYLLCTSDREVTDGVLGLLISALYENKRIFSRRYTILDMDRSFNRKDIRALYNKTEGGVIVLRISAARYEDQYVNNIERNLDCVCEQIKNRRNKVLTVVCMDGTCKKQKERVAEELADISFINICEDTMTIKKAQNYLRRLATTARVTSCRGLYAGLGKAEAINISALKRRFDAWYTKYLCMVEYPLYKSVAKPETADKKSKRNAYAELDAMIGIEPAKRTILSAMDYFKAQRMFSQYKAFDGSPSMHMVFTGNPGTAKTTVARLFAKIMYDSRLLSTGKFVEVGRSDLVGQYVGWTAPIVKKKFRQAKGGMLFIDEAYSLLDDREGMYGDEAINTIVQEMENMRGDVVVIFAGYPEKMRKFLNRNPGLSSRIAFHINFPDYSSDELFSIAEHIARDKKRELSERAQKVLANHFASVSKSPNFGNGRYARTLVERAMMNQATRLLRMGYHNVDETAVATLDAEDFVFEEKTDLAKKRCIGFRSLAQKTTSIYNEGANL